MISEERMREEFEEYASQHYWMREHGFDYSRDVEDEYASDEMQLAWEFWKASRESLVIRVNSAACHDATAGDVLDAIESSGIKWEVEQ